MNAWSEFLTEQGAIWQNDQLESFSGDNSNSISKLIPMVDHSLLLAKGVDAAKFLQGQCTCDIRELEQKKVLLGAQCNRQGRMLSSFAVFGMEESSIGLRLRSNIATETLAELKRYIVFSKATLEHSDWVGLGLVNPKTNDLPFAELPQPGQFAVNENSVLAHHTFGLMEIWTDPTTARELWQHLAKTHQPSPTTELDLFLIDKGIAEVEAATREQFLPQDFNYQAIQAVNFKKGCYTGQEIVARMQYRGQLKKHCYHLKTNSTTCLPLGTELYAPDNPEKKLATIVASAQGAILVVATEETASTTTSLLAPETQTNFEWAKLPYAIP